MKRLVGYGALVCALALLAILGVGSTLSRPVPAHVGTAPPELNARDVTFISGSGASIRGWLSLPGVAPRAAVILLPGVRANRLSMVDRARFLHAAGYAVLLVDLQATGESSGSQITFGWRERLDVLAAVQYVRLSMPGVRIGVIGASLGGAAALLAAPQLRVDALVVEAVYPSIDAAVSNRLRMRFGAAGTLAAPLLLAQLRLRANVSPRDLRPIDRIARVGCPVFVIGGALDRHTTQSETVRLYEAAQQPKELWVVDGAAHVDLCRFKPIEYEQRVLSFLSPLMTLSARDSRRWTPVR